MRNIRRWRTITRRGYLEGTEVARSSLAASISSTAVRSTDIRILPENIYRNGSAMCNGAVAGVRKGPCFNVPAWAGIVQQGKG